MSEDTTARVRLLAVPIALAALGAAGAAHALAAPVETPIYLTAGACAPLPPPDGGEVRVGRLEIGGADLIPDADIAREAEGLVGRAVDRAALDRLAERVTCLHRARGWLAARAVVEPAAGPDVWRLRVTSGRVAAVEVRAEDEGLRRFMQRALEGVLPGEPLRRDDLAKALTLANRHEVWSIETRLRVAPGDPDAVVLVVVPPEPKLSLFKRIDNASPETVDTWASGASLIGHGLTPLYERNVLSVFHAVGSDRQQGVQLGSSALLTGTGLVGRADVSWYRQRPDERPPLPDTVGSTTVARLEAEHPVRVTPNAFVSARAGLEAVRQVNDLASGAPLVRDDLRVAYAGLRVDLAPGPRTGWAALTVRKGLDGLGASRAGDPLLSRTEADPQAGSVRFDAQASRPLGRGQVEVRARGQWAVDPLPAYEEFTFGGGMGRGLDSGALYGDRGFALGLEYVGPRLPVGRGVSPLMFVEGAQAWNEDTLGPRRSRAVMAGAGARVRLSERASVDVVYAQPIGEPEGVSRDVFGPKLMVTLTASFTFDRSRR